MTELKTLKDIEVDNGVDEKFVERWELKQEAIKWVKHWRELDETKCRICDIPTDTDFMHFFNITEEDLK